MTLVMILVVACLHVIAGVLLTAAQPQWPMLVGFAGVAYTLGLRHGFDADHIVAIDGTTRQLLARRRNASGVGFYFSLGHSTVVLLLALWLARATAGGRAGWPWLRTIGGAIGLAVSAVFMLTLAAVNVLIVRDTLRAMRTPAGCVGVIGGPAGGAVTRLFGRALRLVGRAPQMYFVGCLFGLGFDTASEIALLAIAANAAVHALPLQAVLVLPLSFAAGMALVDTAEGMFMVRAYAWALDEPGRRARYNLVVTGFTAIAATAIAALELSGAAGNLGQINSLLLGVGVVAAFPLIWIAAATIARVRPSTEVRDARLST